MSTRRAGVAGLVRLNVDAVDAEAGGSADAGCHGNGYDVSAAEVVAGLGATAGVDADKAGVDAEAGGGGHEPTLRAGAGDGADAPARRAGVAGLVGLDVDAVDAEAGTDAAVASLGDAPTDSAVAGLGAKAGVDAKIVGAAEAGIRGGGNEDTLRASTGNNVVVLNNNTRIISLLSRIGHLKSSRKLLVETVVAAEASKHAEKMEICTRKLLEVNEREKKG
jgi:hypothetical protein